METATSSCKRKTPCQQPDAIKKRKLEWKQKKATESARIEFSYKHLEEKQSIFDKLNVIKRKIGEGNAGTITTFNAIETVMDYYLEMHSVKENDSVCADQEDEYYCLGYQYASREQCETEELFLCTDSSVNELLKRTANHHRNCNSPRRVEKVFKMQQAASLRLPCSNKHIINWTTSPHMEGGKLLVNMKMVHGFFVSGMLPNQFKRLCQASGIGSTGKKYLSELQEEYSEIASATRKKSEENALLQEVACTVGPDADATGIDIMTDAGEKMHNFQTLCV